ncbi:MAG: ABC transporter ATP-binding protein [Wenzhouxiangella sp.]
MGTDRVLSLHQVRRVFHTGSETIGVLDDLSLSLDHGQRVAVMGASGSGKTTLLHLAAGMDRPDAGRVELAGRNLAEVPEPALTRLRARHVGLVFQDFNLLDSLTVRENIELPLWLNHRSTSSSQLEALTQTLGISHLMPRLPETLSGGERQRVAIARALVHEPALLLADEPTGSLDQATADGVLQLFDQVTRQTGCTLLMVTHNPQAAELCEQVLYLRHGQLKTS